MITNGPFKALFILDSERLEIPVIISNHYI